METENVAGRWRRFERTADGRTEYREVRQEGIRCLLRWGVAGGSGRGMTVTRDDVADAGRHAARKAREYLRKGFAEVEAGGGGSAEGPVDGSADRSSDGAAAGSTGG
ncbi:WGR domain-containing protein, partial [Streptomyces sp. UH6]|uniref:WGR domain-containing protein n=1 Tax=Streptomyces sp. UH6 TaxID=2748379 RepID=UPI0015D4BF93|nr:WGR domain-containing protein [Streptomyces sp. UH6]